MIEGWCESCGKELPSYMRSLAARPGAAEGDLWSLRSSRPVRFAFIGIAAAMYTAAFLVPAFNFLGVGDGAAAFMECLRLVAGTPVNHPDWWFFGATWIANPLMWTSALALALGYWRTAAILAGCAFVLPLPCLLCLASVVFPYPSWYLWAGSAAVLLVGSVWAGRIPRPRSDPPSLP